MSSSVSPEPRTTSNKKRRRLDETTAHRSQEKKRRQLINGSIARLKTLVPTCDGKRTTMINVLTATEEYVVAMQAREAELVAQLAVLQSGAPTPPPSSVTVLAPLPRPRSLTPPANSSPALSPALYSYTAPYAVTATPAAPNSGSPSPSFAASLTPIDVIDPYELRATLDKVHREAPFVFPAKPSVSATFASNFAPLPAPVYAAPLEFALEDSFYSILM